LNLKTYYFSLINGHLEIAKYLHETVGANCSTDAMRLYKWMWVSRDREIFTRNCWCWLYYRGNGLGQVNMVILKL